MTPKTKRRLKWKATRFKSGRYWAIETMAADMWVSTFDCITIGHHKTKRQAIAACEKHARENPSKK